MECCWLWTAQLKCHFLSLGRRLNGRSRRRWRARRSKERRGCRSNRYINFKQEAISVLCQFDFFNQETIYGTTRPTTPAKLRANLTQAAAANSTASLKRKAPGQVTPGGPGGGPGGSASGAKRIHLAPSMYRPNATGSAAKASTTGVAAPGSSKSRVRESNLTASK